MDLITERIGWPPANFCALPNKETAPGIEPRIIVLATRSIVTIPTELSGLRD